MKWKIFLMGFLVLAACVGGREEGEKSIVLLGPRGERIPLIVEIADTPEKRARGLMGRTSVPEGTGMLFLFEGEQPLSFWMKNTLVPLDIFFFTQSGEFVSMTTMEPCNPEPARPTGTGEVEGCPGYPSRGPAYYALEVRAGFALDRGVGEGWSISIE